MSPESSPDAAGIARREFNSVRRGYDTKAVRAYLQELSGVVDGLQRQLDEQRERAERAEERATKAEQLDQNRLVELVGEETARVLDSARAAASDIRTKAQEAAARLVSEGRDEARAVVEAAEADGEERRQVIVAESAALRDEAAGELDRRRAEAEAAAAEVMQVAEAERRAVEALRGEAEAQAEALRAEVSAQAEDDAERVRAAAARDGEEVLQRARGEARHLVAEALAVREKLLGDLARRRRTAREQVERLNAARERLLAAYAVVRRTAEEATAELTVALPAARVASDQAARRVNDEPESTPEDVEAELSTARMAGLVDGDTGADLDVDVAALAEQLDVDASTHLDAPEAASWAAPEVGPPVPPPPPPALPDEPSHHLHLVPPPPPPPPPAAPPAGDGDEPDSALGLGPAAPAIVAADVPGHEPPESPSADVRREPAGTEAEEATGVTEPAGPVTPVARNEPPSTMASPPPLSTLAPPPPPPPQEQEQPQPVQPPVVNGASRPEAGRSVDDLFARMRAQHAQPAPDPAATPTTARGRKPAKRSQAAAAPGTAAARTDATTDATTDTVTTGATRASTAARAPSTRSAEAERRPERPTSWPTDVERAAARVSAARGPDAADEVGDAGLLHRRDVALEGIEALLSRRLKRVLADEENDVLDLLRRGVPEGVDDVLPGRDAHVAAYAAAAATQLADAAAEGVSLVGGDGENAEATVAGLSDQLGAALVDPLRARITRSVDDGGDVEEVTSRLRALYREWKGQRIGSAVRHYAAAAYAAGALDGVATGAEVRWVVDRTGEPCPDADDNALAGTVRKGTAFPTGDSCPPAHPGCRCLVVPAAGVTPLPDASDGA